MITPTNFEEISDKILKSLNKNGFYFSKFITALDNLRKADLSSQFNKSNDIISPDLVIKINSFFSYIEMKCDHIFDQMKQVCKISSVLYNLTIPNKEEFEAHKFLKSIINEKYTSLNKDKKTSYF